MKQFDAAECSVFHPQNATKTRPSKGEFFFIFFKKLWKTIPFLLIKKLFFIAKISLFLQLVAKYTHIYSYEKHLIHFLHVSSGNLH